MSAAASARPASAPAVAEHPVAAHDPDPRAYFEHVLGAACLRGNRVDRLKNGDAIFPAMLEAIEDARDTIEFVTYVYWQGDIARRFADALAERAEAGVAVRVVLDGIGARPMDRDLVGRMVDAGVQVRWFRPPTTWRVWRWVHRTHRKVLVCDGRVGFTGGVGIAREWEGDAQDPEHWRDDHFRVEGPAVRALRAAFASNWAEIERRQPFGPDSPTVQHDLERAGDARVHVVRATSSFGQNDVAATVEAALRIARRRVRIATAYFAPDRPYGELLIEAVRRGVEVEVMAPGRHSDSRVSQRAGQRRYDALLDAGVRLWSYERTMLHRKVLLVDDVAAVVGSPNLNHRSLKKDDELCLVVHDAALIATLHADYEADLRDCEAIDPERWARRGGWRRFTERLAAWLFGGHV